MHQRDGCLRRFLQIGWILRPVVLTTCLLACVLPCAADQPPTYSKPVVIRFEGPIGLAPWNDAYFRRKLDQVERDGADLVIVEIDSPGGLVHVALDLATRLRDVEGARTVAFIPRDALSAATFMALGCDDIVIAAEATFGDAGVIFMDENYEWRYAPEKERSLLVSKLRTLAEATNRPPALAAAMVDKDLVVYQVKNRETGEVTYMSEADIGSDDRWEKGDPVPESAEGLFLTVSGRRAVELDMAQANATTYEELKERYGLAGELRVLEYGGVDTAVFILNNWFVTGLLFVIGLIALYIEFSAPGISIGGLIACLCFSLFFWSRFLGGTAGWLEVVLFACGVLFLVVELFVLPGFGVSGLTGLLLIVVSLILASQDFVIPQTGVQWETLGRTLIVVAGSGAVVVVGTVVLSSYFGTIPLVNQLALKPPPPDVVKEGAAGATEGAGLNLGDTGTAESLLRPAGKARFGDRFVDVITDGEFVEKGSAVKIVELGGNRVVVQAVDDVA